MKQKNLETQLPPRQYAAMQRALGLGRILSKDHPEIGELYRGMKTCNDILQELNICDRYDVTERVGLNALFNAIKGHDGRFGVCSYQGLIDDPSEREQLAQKHLKQIGKENGAKIGAKTYELGVGIHGRTTKQMTIDGKKGGSRAYALKAGFHGRTIEQRLEDCQKGGRKAGLMRTLARGQVPWKKREFYDTFCIRSEIEFTYGLSLLPGNKKKSGGIDAEKIANIVNTLYHNKKQVRNANGIKAKLTKHKKFLARQ